MQLPVGIYQYFYYDFMRASDCIKYYQGKYCESDLKTGFIRTVKKRISNRIVFGCICSHIEILGE